MTNTNSFLTMFQSTLIIIKRVTVILQCKLFAPRHEIVTVYAHERTGFAHRHLLAFIDNHNPSCNNNAQMRFVRSDSDA